MDTIRTVRSLGGFAFALFVTYGGLPLSHEAHAGEKRFPGSMCVHWGGPAPTLFFSSLANNSPTGTTQIDCPIVQEHVFFKSGGSVMLNAEVVVIDQHPEEDIRCFLTSVDPSVSTNPPNTFQVKQSTGAGTAAQRIVFGSQQMQGPLAHWYFSCAIPPSFNGHSSSIWSYYVNEED